MLEVDCHCSQMSYNKQFTTSSSLIPGKKTTLVTFKDTVLVFFLPVETFEAQWLARFGVWKSAPFHDELWDGYLDKFRDKPLTKRQLAKANKEYKWRKRLPLKVYKLLFQKGKTPVKLSQARDEVKLMEDRLIKIEAANEKIKEDFEKEKKKSKPKGRLIRKKNPKPKSKPERKKPHPDTAIGDNINYEDDDIVSVDSSGNPIESAPRRHDLKDLYEMGDGNFISSVRSMHNPLMKSEKSAVLSAYDKFEVEVSKRKKSVESRAGLDEASVVSFDMKVKGKNVAVQVPYRRQSSTTVINRRQSSSIAYRRQSSTTIGNGRLSLREVQPFEKVEEVKPVTQPLNEPNVDIIEEEVEEPTIGGLFWALGQAVSSYFYTEHPETEEIDLTLSKEEEDKDTVDNMSVIEEEVRLEFRQTVESMLERGSLASKDLDKEEILRALDEIPRDEEHSKVKDKVENKGIKKEL